MDIIRLELPFPPSVNRYWRRVGNMTKLSKAGREYKVAVHRAVLEQVGQMDRLQGDLRVAVALYPPDRRRRDLDNFAGKAVFDALQNAGCMEDDCQIKELWAVMMDERVPGGRCDVTLERKDAV